jgi:hypothetical protein
MLAASYLHLFVAHNITPSACFWRHLLDAHPQIKTDERSRTFCMRHRTRRHYSQSAMIGSDDRTEGPTIHCSLLVSCTNAQASASLYRIRSMDRGIMKRGFGKERLASLFHPNQTYVTCRSSPHRRCGLHHPSSPHHSCGGPDCDSAVANRPPLADHPRSYSSRIIQIDFPSCFRQRK